MTFILYTKQDCPKCVTAKALLDRSGHAYQTIKLQTGTVTNDGEISRENLLTLFPGARMMPLVAVIENGDWQRVGGLEELKAKLA